MMSEIAWLRQQRAAIDPLCDERHESCGISWRKISMLRLGRWGTIL